MEAMEAQRRSGGSRTTVWVCTRQGCKFTVVRKLSSCTEVRTGIRLKGQLNGKSLFKPPVHKREAVSDNFPFRASVAQALAESCESRHNHEVDA